MATAKFRHFNLAASCQPVSPSSKVAPLQRDVEARSLVFDDLHFDQWLRRHNATAFQKLQDKQDSEIEQALKQPREDFQCRTWDDDQVHSETINSSPSTRPTASTFTISLAARLDSTLVSTELEDLPSDILNYLIGVLVAQVAQPAVQLWCCQSLASVLKRFRSRRPCVPSGAEIPGYTSSVRPRNTDKCARRELCAASKSGGVVVAARVLVCKIGGPRGHFWDGGQRKCVDHTALVHV